MSNVDQKIENAANKIERAANKAWKKRSFRIVSKSISAEMCIRDRDMAILLIVEDDIATNEAICEYMGAAGHTVLSAFDGEQGLAMAKSNRVDLVILDIMLPKVTGIDVLKELRKDSSLPVLMLTALDDEGTQAASFDEEADDYISKPFSMLLLGKRVTALLRSCLLYTSGPIFMAKKARSINCFCRLL